MPSMTDAFSAAFEAARKVIMEEYNKTDPLYSYFTSTDLVIPIYENLYEEYQEELNENLLKCG